VKIRGAGPADVPGIARVHVDTWRTTYAGTVPADYLERLSYGERERLWARVFEEPETTFVYVAEDDSGQIAGFASGGRNTGDDPAYEGSLHAIYVLKEYEGRGLGRVLLLAVANRLARMCIPSMTLWVFAENGRARRFYEAMGGQLGTEQEFEIAGATLKDVSYGWPDVTSLKKGNHE
jgi:ribosomal protein S18 acetylase RimI-like enzyme